MNCKFVLVSIIFYIHSERYQRKAATNLIGPILSIHIRLASYRLREPLENLETATFRHKSTSL